MYFKWHETRAKYSPVIADETKMTTLENPLMMFCVLGVMMKMIKSMSIKRNGKQMTNTTLISSELMCSYEN